MTPQHNQLVQEYIWKNNQGMVTAPAPKILKNPNPSRHLVTAPHQIQEAFQEEQYYIQNNNAHNYDFHNNQVAQQIMEYADGHNQATGNSKRDIRELMKRGYT